MVKTAPVPVSSLHDSVTPVEAGAHIVGAAFLGGTAVFALVDGQVLLAERSGGTRLVAAHSGAGLLLTASDGSRIITGGDDGRILATSASGESEEIGTVPGWVDALVARSDGAIAWSSGKTAFAREAKGSIKTFAAPSTVRGLHFMSKGYRLAVAHYNGVSLWFPNMKAEPEALAWKGSHLDVTGSPDGRFVVSSMQENALHGWRLSDKRDMKMSGYPAKTRSWAWTHDGNWLATSGAEACVVWPFATKDGPMGRAPKELGVRNARVSCVACHPGALVIAIGYVDGFILLARLDDGAEILVRDADTSAVSALAWDSRGQHLIFGTQGGEAGLVTLP